MGIWSELRKRIKPILSVFTADLRKDVEDSLLLDSLKKLFNQNYESIKIIFHQNAKIMAAVVTSLKEGVIKKDESLTVASPVVRTTKLTKPEKVPLWLRNIF